MEPFIDSSRMAEQELVDHIAANACLGKPCYLSAVCKPIK